MTNSLVVGIAECTVSNDPEAVIVTYALGSCIGVAMHDPIARVGGLLHYMLPLSVLDAKQAKNRPCMYCDSGMQILIDQMVRAGAQRNRISVQAAGGAQVLDSGGFFNIGKKNELILRQILTGFKLPLSSGEFGGSVSRTVGLEVSSGRFWIKQWQIGAAAQLAAEPRRIGASG